MKQVFTAGLAMLLLFSCSKKDGVLQPLPTPNPGPAMKYQNLQDTSIGFNKHFKLDIDGNGHYDFFVSTLLVGSPVDQRDYQDYFFSGGIDSYIPVNSEEEMPRLAKGNPIGLQAFPGYSWYNASQLLLSQRVIPLHGQPFWQGSWTSASHSYVPVSIKKNNQYYYGWVELSFDSGQGQVVLHQSAICLAPGVNVIAGQ